MNFIHSSFDRRALVYYSAACGLGIGSTCLLGGAVLAIIDGSNYPIPVATTLLSVFSGITAWRYLKAARNCFYIVTAPIVLRSVDSTDSGASVELVLDAWYGEALGSDGTSLYTTPEIANLFLAGNLTGVDFAPVQVVRSEFFQPDQALPNLTRLVSRGAAMRDDCAVDSKGNWVLSKKALLLFAKFGIRRLHLVEAK